MEVYLPNQVWKVKLGDSHPEAHMQGFAVEKLEVFNNGTFCGATLHYKKDTERVIVDMVGFPVRASSFIEEKVIEKKMIEVKDPKTQEMKLKEVEVETFEPVQPVDERKINPKKYEHDKETDTKENSEGKEKSA